MCFYFNLIQLVLHLRRLPLKLSLYCRSYFVISLDRSFLQWKVLLAPVTMFEHTYNIYYRIDADICRCFCDFLQLDMIIPIICLRYLIRFDTCKECNMSYMIVMEFVYYRVHHNHEITQVFLKKVGPFSDVVSHYCLTFAVHPTLYKKRGYYI